MEKDKDIIEIIVDESDNSFSDAVNFKSILADIKADISPLFIKISCAVCVIVLIISTTVGFLIPKSEKAITDRLSAKHTSDKEYLSVKGAYDSAVNSLKDLENDLSKKQNDLKKFNNSQDSLDKIIVDTENLTTKRDALKSQNETKQRTLSELDATISANKSKTITLISGEYTVGENIAQGKYNVLGNGSIAISRNGKSITNKTLNSDGESFALISGDKLVISGNAKFIPEQ